MSPETPVTPDLREPILDALSEALEWGRKFGADYGEAVTPDEAWRLWAGKDSVSSRLLSLLRPSLPGQDGA